MGQYGGCMLVGADGTRRSYYAHSTGNSYYNSGGVINHSFNGYTTDGSFIDYTCNYYDNGSSQWFYGEAKMPNGTVMTFGSPSVSNDQAFPTKIQDRHGNFINISYVGSQGPAINTITDTLGRTITFNYNGSNLLTDITGPGYNGTTRTFIRLEHSTKTLSYAFNGLTPVIADSTPYILIDIFYPTTNTGYWFNETDSYSSYGILAKIREKRGMVWSGTYISNQGTTSREEVYDFDMTANSSLTDSPGYTTHTETFDGIDTSSLVTTFLKTVNGGGTEETISVTRPDSSKLIQKSHISGTVSNGLQFENRIDNPSAVVLDKTVTTVGSGGSGDYNSPRPTQIEHTDDKGQVKKTEFSYGTSVYNQVTAQKEYNYGGTTPYREKRFTYENGSSYTGRHIFSLVKSEAVYNDSNVRLSLTEYNYDQSAPIGIPDSGTDQIVQHAGTHNPDTSQTVPICVQFNYSECSYEGQSVFNGEYFVTCACTDYDYISAYDSATQYRGNITQVKTYEDAEPSTPTGAITYDFTYDVAGNERTSTTNCCQQIGSSYAVGTQYSMPASITKGSSNTSSPDRITQTFAYDTNTKLPTTITDYNGLNTTITYDAAYRPTLVTLNSGGKKTTTYNDSSLNQNEQVQKSDNTTVSNSTAYFNGRGQVKESRYQAGSSNWNATQIKYNTMGRQWKVSRPYDTGSSPSYWTETTYDYLGRVTQQLAPDATSSTTIAYNATPTPSPTPATSDIGQSVRTTDAWGRQRWIKYDAFGRLVEAIEPEPAGSSGSISAGGAISTVYNYDPLDRLTSIVQGDQTRSFKYDSLGRLTRQKLPEQTASINDAGVYNSGTLVWSDSFVYDTRSNLTQRTDARGVKTNYSYLVSSIPDPLNRLQSISYDTSTADTANTIHSAPTVTFEYMTTGDKTRVKKVTTSGVSTEENTFDGEGRIASYELKLDAHTTKPFKSEYTYDTAHRLTQIKYPKRYGITLNSISEPQMLVDPSYDQASRISQMNVDSETILSDIVYNTSGQVTSLKTATAEAYPRVEGYSYDAATGLLTGQTIKNAALSTTYLDLSYSYTRGNSAGSSSGSEKTGQMTKITNNLIDDRDRKYEFDSLGRLQYAKGGTAAGASSSVANWTQQYTYDRYGNKTATAVSGNSDQNGNPVAADGLTSTATATTTNRISAFTYDKAGNIVRGQNASGVWQRYEYDASGRLKEVQDDSYNDLEIFTYGAGRQKLIMSDGLNTTYYVWGGSSIIAEYLLKSGNPRYQKAYVFAGSRLLMTTERTSSTSEKRETHHPDRLGTKRVIDIDTGTEIEQSTLPFGTAFGAESSGYSNQVFTTYDRSPNTGLDYANNRTYSNGQGRFTQVDPIGMAAASVGNPQSNNLYAYTQNMPTDFVDPSGLNMAPPQTCYRIISGSYWEDGDGFGLRFDEDRIVCFGGGGSSENGGTFGGSSGSSRDNKGPVAVFSSKKFKECLKMFGAKASRRVEDGIATLGGSDVAMRFSGTIDGRQISVTTRFGRSAADLGLDLKSNGVGNGRPESGATIGNYPQNNDVAREVRTGGFQPTAVFALYIHELGNALAGIRYINGGSTKKIGDFSWGGHTDAGAAFEYCVYGGIVGLRSGRIGTSREF